VSGTISFEGRWIRQELKKGIEAVRNTERKDRRSREPWPGEERRKKRRLAGPRFGDLLVGRFVNSLMRMGKKSVAERIFYDAMEAVKDKAKEDPLTLFKKALENVKPLLEVRPRRVGGATYQVPVEVREERRVSLAVKWLITPPRSVRGGQCKKS